MSIKPEWSFAWFVLLVIAILFALAVICQPASAHEMNQHECEVFAQDMYVAALSRDRHVPLKDQIAEAAKGIDDCQTLKPSVCIYRDQQDNAEAINELSWMYEQGRALNPEFVRIRIRQACILRQGKK